MRLVILLKIETNIETTWLLPTIFCKLINNRKRYDFYVGFMILKKKNIKKEQQVNFFQNASYSN